MEYDRLKFTHVVSIKSDISLPDDGNEEVYAVPDGQLLTHIVG
jgi:hypothetical protein